MHPLLPALLAALLACKDKGDGGHGTDTSRPSDTGETGDTGDTEETGHTGDTGVPVDADGDGYPEETDCDDGDRAVHPGADELCNDADDDCDGDVDEDPTDPGTWYVDSDGDGFGGAGSGTVACDPPSGTIADGTDCDDADAAIHPGLHDDCEDGVDADCNGVDPACGVAPLADVTGTVYRGENPGDMAGVSLAMGDMDGDGLDDVVAGATFHGYGSDYLVLSPRTGEIDLGTADAEFVSAERAHTGHPYVGDADGDGFVDLAHYASYYVSVLHGPFEGGHDVEDGDLVIDCVKQSDQLGEAVTIGDLDGDGAAELAVGGVNYNGSGTPRRWGGSVFLFDGDLEGTYDSHDVEGLATALLWGADDFEAKTGYGDSAGATLAHGDFNADGLDDLAVGAPGHTTASLLGQGAAYLVLGPVSGEQELADADATWEGEVADEQAGGSFRAGDVDGDGASDLAIGAPFSGRVSFGGGAAWVVTGFDAGTHSLADAHTRIEPAAADGGLGQAFAIGDWAGSGTTGLAVAADTSFVTGGRDGAAYVWNALPGGTLTSSAADSVYHGNGDYAGRSLASGDVDGDGAFDLLVGAPSTELDKVDPGAAWLVFGG